MEQTLCLGPSVHTAIRGCQLNSSHKCFPLIIYIRAGRWTLLLAVTAFTDQTFSIVHLIFLLSLSVSGCLMASHSSEDWLTYHSMTCRCSLYPMTLESKSTWTRSVPGGFVFLFFNKTIKKIWKKSLPQENVLGKNLIFTRKRWFKKWRMVTVLSICCPREFHHFHFRQFD